MRELPVDSEVIRQRIYEAGRSIGRNDPFLASELTDSLMHFLEQDDDGRALAPDELLESVTKIIGELGHPQLAIAIEQSWHLASNESSTTASLGAMSNRDGLAPRQDRTRVVNSHLCEYSLAHVYPSSIVAGHELGLIELQHLDLPFELIGGIAELSRRAASSERGLMSVIAHSRHRFGRFLELRLPEVVPQNQSPNDWFQALAVGLEMAQLSAYLHIPRVVPGAMEDSSLFTDVDAPRPLISFQDSKLFPEDVGQVSPNLYRLAWVKVLVQAAGDYIHPVISVEASDFDDLTFVELLHVLVVNGMPATFALSRGDQAGWQVTGGRVNCPAESGAVQANLSALFTTSVRMGSESNPLDRLGGLVRLAFAAGRAKQAFLRRNGHPTQREGFLLDRSAVVVQPAGIAEFTRQLIQVGVQGTPSDLENTVWQRLQRAARECSAHGPPCVLRRVPFTLATPSTTVPNYCEETSIAKRLSMFGSGQELLDMLLRLYRETRVSAVWINGGE